VPFVCCHAADPALDKEVETFAKPVCTAGSGATSRVKGPLCRLEFTDQVTWAR
jgi:hypothetical protein